MHAAIAQLILVITASHSGAVGFGETFDCEVRRVIAGATDESRIRLSIMASDKSTLGFVLAHLHPVEIEVGFRVHRKDEPYSLSPISGFVDKSRTSWVIDSIGEAKE